MNLYDYVFHALRLAKSEGNGFDSPVGTEAERMGGKIWPGSWVDATPFAKYYTAVGPAYHTGADLNLNIPTYDADKLAPIYSIGNGVVTHSGVGSGTWGHVIVIRHEPLPDGRVVYSRYAHVEQSRVKRGDRVLRGTQIANIGNAQGRLPYHLHFDISLSSVLGINPYHWPGTNWTELINNYADPANFIRANRPQGGYMGIKDELIATLEQALELAKAIEEDTAPKVLVSPTVENLRMRSGPSLTATILKSLSTKDKLVKLGEIRGDTIVGRGDLWFWVQHLDGTIGCCHASYMASV